MTKTIQTVLPQQLYKDLEKYSKDAGIKIPDMIRHLLRIEMYYEQSLIQRIDLKYVPVKQTEKQIVPA